MSGPVAITPSRQHPRLAFCFLPNMFGYPKLVFVNNNFGLIYKTGNIYELSQKLKFAIRNFKNCKIKIKNAKKNLIKLSKKNDTYIKFFNKI